MTPDERAARIADARALLDILEADESLPLPGELKHLGFYFRADGPEDTTRRQFAALESALPAVFDDGKPDGGDWVITGLMAGGVKIRVRGWAKHVAEEITTVKQAEVKEWRRLPVPDEAPESGERA